MGDQQSGVVGTCVLDEAGEFGKSWPVGDPYGEGDQMICCPNQDTLRVREGAILLGPQDKRHELELSWGLRGVQSCLPGSTLRNLDLSLCIRRKH